MCRKATLFVTTLLSMAATANSKPLHKLVFAVDAMKHIPLGSTAPVELDRIDVSASDGPYDRPYVALASYYHSDYDLTAEKDVYVVEDAAAFSCYHHLLRDRALEVHFRNAVAHSSYVHYNVFGTLSVYIKGGTDNPCKEEKKNTHRKHSNNKSNTNSNKNKNNNNSNKVTDEKLTSEKAMLVYIVIALGCYSVYLSACFMLKRYHQRKFDQRWSARSDDRIKVGCPLPQLNGERCAICLDDFFPEHSDEEAEADTKLDHVPKHEATDSKADSNPDTTTAEVETNKETEATAGALAHPLADAHPLAEAANPEVDNQEAETDTETQPEAVPEQEQKDELLLSATLICGHAFHTECLQVWLRRKKSCPTCRATLSLTAGRDLFLLTRKAERARKSPGVAVRIEKESAAL